MYASSNGYAQEPYVNEDNLRAENSLIRTRHPPFAADRPSEDGQSIVADTKTNVVKYDPQSL